MKIFKDESMEITFLKLKRKMENETLVTTSKKQKLLFKSKLFKAIHRHIQNYI